MNNCLDCKILRAVTLTFINKKGLNEEFSSYAIDLLLDDIKMDTDEVHQFLSRMKEDQSK